MILVSIIYNLVASALYLGVAGGFTLEWLVGFVKEANNLKGSSGGTLLNQLLASIKKACADTAKLFADTPDVATMEEKFLAYMGRHGGTMADHKAAIDKSVHQFRATVAKLKVPEAQADPDKDAAAATTISADILDMILIFTMTTLLRNPAVANKKETALRGQLKSVRDQLLTSSAKEAVPHLLKEVAELLGEQVVTGLAAPSVASAAHSLSGAEDAADEKEEETPAADKAKKANRATGRGRGRAAAGRGTATAGRKPRPPPAVASSDDPKPKRQRKEKES